MYLLYIIPLLIFNMESSIYIAVPSLMFTDSMKFIVIELFMFLLWFKSLLVGMLTCREPLVLIGQLQKHFRQ